MILDSCTIKTSEYADLKFKEQKLKEIQDKAIELNENFVEATMKFITNVIFSKAFSEDEINELMTKTGYRLEVESEHVKGITTLGRGTKIIKLKGKTVL